MINVVVSLVITLLLTLALPGFAAQLYRYKDEQGNYVLNQTIPPKFVSKGYEILNNQGRVIKRVAPALTPEEIAERDAQLERERLLKIEREKQAARDAELQQLYSHPDDAVRVLNRRISDIKALIQVKNGHISTSQSRIVEEETFAAERQRKGLNINEATFEKIALLKSQISNNKQDIAELLGEKEKAIVEFSAIIKRLETITGKKATKPLKLDIEPTESAGAVSNKADSTSSAVSNPAQKKTDK